MDLLALPVEDAGPYLYLRAWARGRAARARLWADAPDDPVRALAGWARWTERGARAAIGRLAAAGFVAWLPGNRFAHGRVVFTRDVADRVTIGVQSDLFGSPAPGGRRNHGSGDGASQRNHGSHQRNDGSVDTYSGIGTSGHPPLPPQVEAGAVAPPVPGAPPAPGGGLPPPEPLAGSSDARSTRAASPAPPPAPRADDAGTDGLTLAPEQTGATTGPPPSGRPVVGSAVAAVEARAEALDRAGLRRAAAALRRRHRERTCRMLDEAG